MRNLNPVSEANFFSHCIHPKREKKYLVLGFDPSGNAEQVLINESNVFRNLGEEHSILKQFYFLGITSAGMDHTNGKYISTGNLVFDNVKRVNRSSAYLAQMELGDNNIDLDKLILEAMNSIHGAVLIQTAHRLAGITFQQVPLVKATLICTFKAIEALLVRSGMVINGKRLEVVEMGSMH